MTCVGNLSLYRHVVDPHVLRVWTLGLTPDSLSLPGSDSLARGSHNLADSGFSLMQGNNELTSSLNNGEKRRGEEKRPQTKELDGFISGCV